MTIVTIETQTTTTPPAFCGWWRPGKGVAWSKLAEAPTYDAALAALLDAIAAVRGGDSLVTRAGTDPNAPRRPYHAGGRRML